MSVLSSCLLTSRHHAEVPALPGLAVCGRCRGHLVRILSDIRDLWPTVAGRVEPSRAMRSDGFRVPGFGPSSPANDFVLSLLDWRTSIPVDGRGPVSIPAVVHGWADTVRAERGLSTSGPRSSVASALAYLAAHVDHLAGAEWIGDAVDELAAVARACRAVTGVRHPVDLRACPGGPVGPCSGVLRLDGPALVCPVCGRSWERQAWAELAGANVWLSGAELAELFGIPEGTVRYWASVDQWARNGPRGHVRYALSDAKRTHAARRGHVVPEPLPS